MNCPKARIFGLSDRVHRSHPVFLAIGAVLVAGAFAGCSDDTGDEPAKGEDHRIVVFGDNLSSSPDRARSWIALLQKNEDSVFPAFKGKDLATINPKAEVVRLDRGGDSYFSVAATDSPYCLCGQACDGDDETCLDATDTRPTTLIVVLGANDLLSTFLQMLSDKDLREKPEKAVADFEKHVTKVLGLAKKSDHFKTPPKLIVANVYDPSDGAGDFATIAGKLFPIPNADKITKDLALSVMKQYRDIIAKQTKALGGTVFDVHSHFLGHGHHYSDAANAHYDKADETRWLRGAIDPNYRGAHELRRLFWQALQGESITAIPTDVPVAGVGKLPKVPSNGWAKAVAVDKVAKKLVKDDTDYINLGADAKLILGKPQGGFTDGVALGILGNYVVVDMGEDTAATDGKGDDIVVMEIGLLTGGTPEPYRVKVGASKDGPWTTLSDGMGEQAFDLAPAGIKSARFIRIESMVSLADATGGLGSPLYPGPEVDAVGAVFPGKAK